MRPSLGLGQSLRGRDEIPGFVEDVETSGRVKSDLHFEIFKQFREHAVAIATPSQVIVSVDRLPEGVTVSRAG